MTADETLRRAAKIIRERGWIQGTTSMSGGPVCAAGAISVVLGVHRWRVTEAHLLAASRAGVPPERAGASGLTRWNDAPGRTVEEVLAVLDPEQSHG